MTVVVMMLKLLQILAAAMKLEPFCGLHALLVLIPSGTCCCICLPAANLS